MDIYENTRVKHQPFPYIVYFLVYTQLVTQASLIGYSSFLCWLHKMTSFQDKFSNIFILFFSFFYKIVNPL